MPEFAKLCRFPDRFAVRQKETARAFRESRLHPLAPSHAPEYSLTTIMATGNQRRAGFDEL